MGEAKRRGDFESRKAQAVQQAEYEAAKRRVEQADREATERINCTSAKRTLALILAAAFSGLGVLLK